MQVIDARNQLRNVDCLGIGTPPFPIMANGSPRSVNQLRHVYYQAPLAWPCRKGGSMLPVIERTREQLVLYEDFDGQE